jgi:hypothetical protein
MPIEQHPALNPERTELRSRAGLKPLDSREMGFPIARVSEGVYGFTTSAATDEVAVFDKPVFRSFELHKLKGGEVLYIGFLTDSDKELLENRQEPGTINLYPDPWEQATNLVQVPASRIDRKRAPLRDNGSPMKLDIAPRP